MPSNTETPSDLLIAASTGNNTMITLDDLLRWGACYEPGRLAELFAEPKTVMEVLTLSGGPWANVPPKDRLWVVLQKGVLDDRTLRLFACECADRAIARIAKPDPRSVDAVRVAREFAEGRATGGELRAAESAAARAAESAESAVARAVARAAAWAAARAAGSAARSAAFAAAESAAWAAESAAESAAARSAGSAGWAAERDAQLLTMIEQNPGAKQ